MVAVKIDKNEIREGIREGFYTKAYKHTNTLPESDDNDDYSDNKHTVLMYINQDYNVAGVKSFYRDSPQFEGNVRIPILLHQKISQEFNLFMLTEDHYKVLKVCDGFNTIEQITDITQIPLEKLEKMIETLKQKKLISVIKRSEI